MSEYYFYVSGGDLQSVSMDMFAPTKVIISLSNINSSSFIVNVFEMYDLNGNLAENIFYQFDCNFNIEINEINTKPILYPNPSNGLFNLTLQEDLNNIKVYNLQGKLILSELLTKGENKINLTKSGFYFLGINDLNFIPLIIK